MVSNFFGCPVFTLARGLEVADCDALRQLQEGMAKDPEFAKLMAHIPTIAQLTGRNISVAVDL